jgi:D-sedoheptulose 7-phosphate isomerase
MDGVGDGHAAARAAGAQFAAKIVAKGLGEHERVMSTISALSAEIVRAHALIHDSLTAGGKLLVCGNGGSAADAQHVAAELVGRFKLERKALPAIALTTNTSITTAVANDYSFDEVFARQIAALGRVGDVLLAISTSGTSANVVRAAEAARAGGLKVIALTGEGGGRLAGVCDVLLAVPSTDTPRTQEAHLVIEHILCELAEASLC